MVGEMDQAFPYLFSLLIANYNNGCYLQETIDSILMQDYRRWEVIIVDDCSTDQSFEIYEKYREDPRFHIFRNERNRGVGYTKRRCVEMAHGELCAFMDPDDVLVVSDAMSVMARTHQEHPEASMVYSGMYRGDEHLQIVMESPGKTIPDGSSGLEMRCWPFHPFLSFKMSSYQLTEGIDPFMRNAEDYDLYYQLEEVGKTIHLDCLQYIQRNNPRSLSLNSNKYKSAVWHSYACIKAMRRRGLEDESLMLFPVEQVIQKAYDQGYEKAASSKAYKLGKVLFSPLRWFSRRWKK